MNTLDYRFELARRNLQAGLAKQAIDQLSEVLAEAPNVAIYHGVLAAALLAEKRLVAAEHENGIALKLDASEPLLHHIQARILLLKGKLKEAHEACDEYLRFEPESADGYLLKAELHRVQDDRSKSKINLDRAAELAPDDLDVAVAFGDYHNTVGESELALEFATQALRIDAQSDSANVLMGETQLALGNLEDADYHAKFAVIQNPHNECALRLMANIRMRKSLFIGVWWRFNTWLSTLGQTRSALVLISGFLLFNLCAEIAHDLGHSTLAATLTYGWLVIVVYSWVGIPAYYRVLKEELAKFEFNPRF